VREERRKAGGNIEGEMGESESRSKKISSKIKRLGI
jgi:hypothetical protein